jgi:hypothetical protein
MKHVSPPPAVDLLTQALEVARPYLNRSFSLSHRARNFWAAVAEARDRGAFDVIEQEFAELAEQTGLTRDLGDHGMEDIAHLIRWGLTDRYPFSEAPDHDRHPPRL